MIARLGLGTVQFGLDYGIANRQGKPDHTTAKAIIARAAADGCAMLDTAAGYGDSETLLGSIEPPGCGLPIFSKLDALPVGIAPNAVRDEIRRRLQASLDRLRLKTLDGYLVHNAADLQGASGAILVEVLSDIKQEGLARAIGVSVYDSAQIDSVLARFTPDVIQLPHSIVDRRLAGSGHLAKLADLGVEIHARSAFLQGLLLMSPGDVPQHLAQLAPVMKLLRARADEANISALQAALRFVLDTPEITVAVIGVQNLADWQQCAAVADNAASIDPNGLSCNDPAIVDPRRWA